jgi:hypothetical protein
MTCWSADLFMEPPENIRPENIRQENTRPCAAEHRQPSISIVTLPGRPSSLARPCPCGPDMQIGAGP